MRLLTLTAACALIGLSAGTFAKAQEIDDSIYQTKCDKDKITCATFRCDRYNEHSCVRISDWFHRGTSDSDFRYRAPYYHGFDWKTRVKCDNNGQDCVVMKCDADDVCRPLPTQTDDDY